MALQIQPTTPVFVQPTGPTSSAPVTPASIGALIGPPTPAEIAAGVTVFAPWLPVGDMGRYGIVPNNAGAAAANGAILQTLWAASVPNGPTGRFVFPNTTGADTYYFDLRFYAIRDGVHVDLQNCTLNFATGVPTAGKPILMWIRDFRLENGTLVHNSVSTSGLMLGGSRYNDGIGWAANPTAPLGIQDQDDLLAKGKPLQGGYVLQNLRISSNNSAQQTLNLIGGLRNVKLNNLWFDGQGVALGAIYYEWGVASTTINGGVPANPWTWTTSHASEMEWSNIIATNHATGGTHQAIGANGAHNMKVENIYVNGCDIGLNFGSGEAFYFRPWAQDGAYGTPRRIKISNYLALNTPVAGAQLTGAQACGPGTLMYNAINALGSVAKSQAQTDYLDFEMDGFKIYSDGGVAVAGRKIELSNGLIKGSGAGSSGGIFCGQDTLRLTLRNVEVRDVNGNGIRNNVIPGTPLWATFRPKFMRVQDCVIAGNSLIGIAVDQMQSVVIENSQIGYNTVEGDTANESTQTTGINVGANCAQNAVVCRGNLTTATTAYANIGPYQVIQNERNTGYATSGNWITQQPTATLTGWGTPTGAAVIANFPGATATLAQTSSVVAQIIATLKANGIFGT